MAWTPVSRRAWPQSFQFKYFITLSMHLVDFNLVINATTFSIKNFTHK